MFTSSFDRNHQRDFVIGRICKKRKQYQEYRVLYMEILFQKGRPAIEFGIMGQASKKPWYYKFLFIYFHRACGIGVIILGFNGFNPETANKFNMGNISCGSFPDTVLSVAYPEARTIEYFSVNQILTEFLLQWNIKAQKSKSPGNIGILDLFGNCDKE